MGLYYGTADRKAQTHALRLGCKERLKKPFGDAWDKSGTGIPNFNCDSFGTLA